ncbi:bifunctional 4-hydroxy-2-oxoglutarate aldolase/2-dehydro-3-deoxy-phosphogluconate aldolase [Alteribacter keqinensis]|uniref:Bifunctional 4-hydroxy-2-oxoglutarate aldolase/2-dehydro-3-deoxy-phosphogluconate aldolase n=1 Tax=Alteribacter keqinensis TaxID=2483800 RepID=A0A3M7TQK4_9BACI|nr:bifunctional 4-hydroxy-2-oxoglutarate aldolase/2-dehydro-3-deoxy-phosphogluconate aldolase [Alteribacter keqinensis]RNA67701.1 bifunctional 4-hydroxy-2-oxoglutarate aldolase/2-dehydro-3-deoxy-phosphogluconate aldolase [Alteribacter keqinensis]
MSFLLENITDSGIVAVIRGARKDSILDVAEALSEGGVKSLEITVETPGAMGVIEKLASEFTGGGVSVGAGTVLDAETARAAILSGAQFIFSPTLNVDTIKIVKRYGAVSVPGAFTPTEVLTAFEHGADMVKVFPARTLGASFIKDMKGPLPQIPLIATGGIDLSNAGAFIEAGAAGVGLGSTLVPSGGAMTEEKLSAITERARAFVELVARVRAGGGKEESYRV